MSNTDAIVQRIIDIVKTSTQPKRNLANLKQNQDIVPAIVEIIKRSIPEAPQVVAQAPSDTVVPAIIKAVKNGIRMSPEVTGAAISTLPSAAANAVIQVTPPDVLAKAITNAVLKSLGNVPKQATVEKLSTEANQTNSLVSKILLAIQSSLPPPQTPPPGLVKPEGAIGTAYYAGVRRGWVFGTPERPLFKLKGRQELMEEHQGWRLKRREGTTKYDFYFTRKSKEMFGPEPQPNFMEPKVTGKNNQGRNTYNQTPPALGYVLTTRNGKTGWYRNKPPVVTTSGPVSGPAPPPPQPRDYSKMTIRELLQAMRNFPANRTAISEALRKAFDKELRDLRYEYSRSRRVRKLGDLLRLLPRNYNGRRNASSMVVNDVRGTRNSRDLSNLSSNLGRVPNENIRRAIENQRRRFEEERRRTGGSSARRYGNSYEPRRYGNSYEPRRYGNSYEPRRYGNSYEPRRYGNSYEPRRYTSGSNEEELKRRRRAARLSAGGGNGGAPPPLPVNRGLPISSTGGNGGAPPPLPVNQQRAINNVGGANKAMNTIVKIPGGAAEVAKAAEALNETGGNAVQAIQIKGASPEAVKAVQNLGGPKNTVVVLEGLNTLARKTPPKKKGGKRQKKFRPRIAELNRVLEAVKKQRLISLTAHNVTKTHNIHPNDEKLKKYYKKVLKANILRTPFAKIVKRAAKKNVSSRA